MTCNAIKFLEPRSGMSRFGAEMNYPGLYRREVNKNLMALVPPLQGGHCTAPGPALWKQQWGTGFSALLHLLLPCAFLAEIYLFLWKQCCYGYGGSLMTFGRTKSSPFI